MLPGAHFNHGPWIFVAPALMHDSYEWASAASIKVQGNEVGPKAGRGHHGGQISL